MLGYSQELPSDIVINLIRSFRAIMNLCTFADLYRFFGLISFSLHRMATKISINLFESTNS